MLRKVVPPLGRIPAPAPAAPAPNSGLGKPKPRQARRKPSPPMTGEPAVLPAPRINPNLVRYEMRDGVMTRRWIVSFIRPGGKVLAGWMEEGSPEELAARAAAMAQGPVRRLDAGKPAKGGTR